MTTGRAAPNVAAKARTAGRMGGASWTLAIGRYLR